MAWAKGNGGGGGLNINAFLTFFKTGENLNETDENGNSLLGNYVSSAKYAWRIAQVLSALLKQEQNLTIRTKPANPSCSSRKSMNWRVASSNSSRSTA